MIEIDRKILLPEVKNSIILEKNIAILQGLYMSKCSHFVVSNSSFSGGHLILQEQKTWHSYSFS